MSVVIIRHASERGRASGSARLIPAAVAGARMLDYGVPGQALDIGDSLALPAWLLFPDPAHPMPKDARPKTLIVLDGTWPQARKMRQKIPELRGRPIMNLPGRAGVFLRQVKVVGQMPTALAVADALEALDEAPAAESLRAAFAALRRQMHSLGKLRLASRDHN